MTKTIIIVAGGTGSRMGADLPKQFLPIQGKPLLMYTLEAFCKYNSPINIILCLPATELNRWKAYCIEHNFEIKHSIVEGGETRFHSVLNAIKTVGKTDIIAVHDGVRPFVSQKVLDNCFNAIADYDAVVPAILLVDSLREVRGSNNFSVPRSNYRIIQTPQVFKAELLINAYKQVFNKNFTDDASVVESYGTTIHLVEGNKENIKITTPFDLVLAEALVNNNNY